MITNLYMYTFQKLSLLSHCFFFSIKHKSTNYAKQFVIEGIIR